MNDLLILFMELMMLVIGFVAGYRARFREQMHGENTPPPCPDCGRPMTRREPWTCAKCGEEMDA